MSANLNNNWDKIFKLVADSIKEKTGNILAEKHMQMVKNRISKRMYELGLNQPEEYLSHLSANSQEEADTWTDILTTHHTFFMREFVHFSHLAQNLKDIIQTVKSQNRSSIRIWSAACSFGHEAYSIAMVIRQELKKLGTDISFEIVGTDVSPKAVQVAENGVYKFDELKSVQAEYLADNWQKGTGSISAFVKASPKIKKHCSFKVANIVNAEDPIFTEKFDLIFCRNVFIYFDAPTIESIVNRQVHQLHPGGFLISGVTESLSSYALKNVSSLGNSIYQKEGAAAKEESAPASSQPKKTRVLCVDDSPLVLKLLQKVLSGADYEIVGTAKDGEDAHQKVKELKPDVITLDVHMPVCDGLSYLKKYHDKDHPPVIVVSSVSYEDGDIIPNLFKAGASDFVEKPELSNLAKVGTELKNKITTALNQKGTHQNKEVIAKDLELKKTHDQDFSDCLQIVVGDSMEEALQAIEPRNHWKHLVVLTDPSVSDKEFFKNAVDLGFKNISLEKPNRINPKIDLTIAQGFDPESLKTVESHFPKISLCTVGKASPRVWEFVQEMDWHLTVSDQYLEEASDFTKDIVPVTSFSYHARKAFLNWQRQMGNGPSRNAA